MSEYDRRVHSEGSTELPQAYKTNTAAQVQHDVAEYFNSLTGRMNVRSAPDSLASSVCLQGQGLPVAHVGAFWNFGDVLPVTCHTYSLSCAVEVSFVLHTHAEQLYP